MTQKESDERQVVILLSKGDLNSDEVKLLKNLLHKHMDWSKVMGLLIFNRIIGISWNTVKKHEIKDEFKKPAYRYLFKNLELTHRLQQIRVLEQLKHTQIICDALSDNDIPYALLKGLILSSCAYQDLGSRDFNDNDILVHPKNIDKTIRILKQLGYIQGKYNSKDDTILEESRKNLLLHSMISHEVYPFAKVVKANFLDVHKVDIQFSIDLMSNNRTDSIVDQMLDSSYMHVITNSNNIRTLNIIDHLIFLCIHFYKEATSYNEVIQYRDLLLYKICDIHHLISNNTLDWEAFAEKALNYDVNEACYYSFLFTEHIYGSQIIPNTVLNYIKPNDIEYISKVFYYDRSKLAHKWKDQIIDRVFDMNRPSKLMK